MLALRASAALALVVLGACGIDSPTAPSRDGGMLAPSDASRALTGATSTLIFPTIDPAFPTRGDARGLNASGQVTGAEIGLTSVDDFRPYRWTPGSGAVMLTGCCDTEWGADINDAGVVVGTAQTSQIVGNRGFVAAGTTMTPLPILAGADPELSAGAVAINNAGQIVGFSPSPSGARHAVLWSAAGVIQDLGTLGGTTSEAVDINASGQVIGRSQIAGDLATHFFLWSSATGMQDLNTLLGPITGVVEINDAGQIIGTYTADGGASHAFLYTPGSGLRDLGTLGGATSAPTGLNNNGQVVGNSSLADATTHAFLWTPTDGMEDITAVTGITGVRRLNDNLQTLGAPVSPPTQSPDFGSTGSPRLVQLNFTPSAPDAPPVAAFTWTCIRKQCAFDARSSTDDHGIVSYEWDFDRDHGGGKSRGALARTTYPKGGTHDVTLTVTDTKGQTASVTHSVAVP